SRYSLRPAVGRIAAATGAHATRRRSEMQSFWPLSHERGTLLPRNRPNPMEANMDDRRLRRSSDPLVALHYQLSSARARGDLDAIVVADPSGVVVAGAGSWPVCEELAAYAPLLADGQWAVMSDNVSSRVETLRREVDVRAVAVGEQ